MLDEHVERNFAEACLSSGDSQVILPVSEDEFLTKSGPLPTMPDDLRRFQRLHFRSKATCRARSTLPAFPREEHDCVVFTRDVSRGGIGFLSHEQLFPFERASLVLAQLGHVTVTVTSCRQIGPCCYEIGAEFTNSDVD